MKFTTVIDNRMNGFYWLLNQPTIEREREKEMETNHPSSGQKTVKTVMIIKVKLFSLSIVNKYIMIIIVDSFDCLSKTI